MITYRTRNKSTHSLAQSRHSIKSNYYYNRHNLHYGVFVRSLRSVKLEETSCTAGKNWMWHCLRCNIQWPRNILFIFFILIFGGTWMGTMDLARKAQQEADDLRLLHLILSVLWNVIYKREKLKKHKYLIYYLYKLWHIIENHAIVIFSKNIQIMGNAHNKRVTKTPHRKSVGMYCIISIFFFYTRRQTHTHTHTQVLK